MLRPATPLTILLFASFVLLLLSVLSTPVIKGIPIAKFKEVTFGVFGYCEPAKCTGIAIGYTTDGVFNDNDQGGGFSLPTSARHSLSALLVVHPIAAFFNLVCLGLAGAAHLHSPSHSARYLLGLLILLLPTLLVTLLAFLVDVLLFVPHLQWGGWIVLASTILITASGVVTCAMRRTLVNRKARKKRIAENAEMSGENFYSRQDTFQKGDMASPLNSAGPTMPAVNSMTGSDTTPMLTNSSKGMASYDGRIDPSRGTPSARTDPIGSMGYVPGYGDAAGLNRSTSHDHSRSPQDEHRSPFAANGPPGPPRALHRDPSNPSLRQAPSREQIMNGVPTGTRGGFGHRGRGGSPAYYPPGTYGPAGNGYGGSRGGMNAGYGRGGYHDGIRHHSGGGRGGAMNRPIGAPQQAPPSNYPPRERQMSNHRFGSREDLRRDPSMGEIRSHSVEAAMRQPMSGPTPPLPQNGQIAGQAVAMNAGTGHIHDRSTAGPDGVTAADPQASRSSPGDVHESAHMPSLTQTFSNHSSTYSQGPDAYVPPRTEWTPNSRNTGSPNYSRPNPIVPAPAPDPASSKVESRPRASSDYYEDVAPRFSETAAEPPLSRNEPGRLPRSLTAGSQPAERSGLFPPVSSHEHLAQHLPDGARSPTGSDVSHYTSVSQRGVNPRWKPESGGVKHMPGHDPGLRQPFHGTETDNAPRDRDVLLQSNPDFAIPGMGPPRSGGINMPREGASGPRGVGASGFGPAAAAATAAPSTTSAPIPGNGLNGAGRYPPPPPPA